MQANGNLVLDQVFGNGSLLTLWTSGTAGLAVAEALMQSDGNLVIYGANHPDGSINPLWATGTYGNPGAMLAVQDDGELVISPGGGGNPLWAYGALPPGLLTLFPGDSITSPSGQYQLTFQTDGDLVLDQILDDGSTQALWDTGTAGQGALEAVMQSDGNFVIYGADNPNRSYDPLWVSNTAGNPGAIVEVQDDGTFDIASADGDIPILVFSGLPPGNQTLLPGDSITSPDGQYELTFATDGDLVLDQLLGNGSSLPLWDSGTAGQVALEAVLQADGNLVLFGPENAAGSWSVLWASNTSGNPGATLAVQDDGSLVISPVGGGNPIWATSAIPPGNLTLLEGDSITSPNGQYELTLQTDGNLVLDQLRSDGSTQTLWSSGTAGTPAIEAVMQTDGNLVIFGADNPNGSYDVLWAANTSGNPGATLAVQDDGSLAIYPAGGGSPIWATLAIPTGSVTLFVGDSITSPSGQYQLTLETDGNLILDQLLGNRPTRVLWASGTTGMPALEAVMQPDGNFVLYAADNPDGSYDALWASNTSGHPGATLAVQNTGSLVISPAGKTSALWATKPLPMGPLTLFAGGAITSPNGQYALTLQPDGNLVLDQLLGNGFHPGSLGLGHRGSVRTRRRDADRRQPGDPWRG